MKNLILVIAGILYVGGINAEVIKSDYIYRIAISTSAKAVTVDTLPLKSIQLIKSPSALAQDMTRVGESVALSNISNHADYSYDLIEQKQILVGLINKAVSYCVNTFSRIEGGFGASSSVSFSYDSQSMKHKLEYRCENASVVQSVNVNNGSVSQFSNY